MSERFAPGSKAHVAALALMDAWRMLTPEPSGAPLCRLEYTSGRWWLYETIDGDGTECLADAVCPIQAVVEAEMRHQESGQLLRREWWRGETPQPVLTLRRGTGVRWPLGDSHDDGDEGQQ